MIKKTSKLRYEVYEAYDNAYENIGLFIKKDKLFDFIRKASNYGFIKDNDGDYICKKILSNDNKELYLNITVNLMQEYILNLICLVHIG